MISWEAFYYWLVHLALVVIVLLGAGSFLL